MKRKKEVRIVRGQTKGEKESRKKGKRKLFNADERKGERKNQEGKKAWEDR